MMLLCIRYLLVLFPEHCKLFSSPSLSQFSLSEKFYPKLKALQCCPHSSSMIWLIFIYVLTIPIYLLYGIIIFAWHVFLSYMNREQLEKRGHVWLFCAQFLLPTHNKISIGLLNKWENKLIKSYYVASYHLSIFLTRKFCSLLH